MDGLFGGGVQVDRWQPAAHTPPMGVSPLPARGGVHFDARDGGRALRVTAHPEHGLVTISMWRGDRCVATHRLTTDQVPALIQTLALTLVTPTPTTAHTAAS